MRSSDKKRLLQIIGVLILLGTFAWGISTIIEAKNDGDVAIGGGIMVVGGILLFVFYKWSND